MEPAPSRDHPHTVTTTKLLESLLDPNDHDAWSTLCTRHRPILEGFVGRLGLGREDAADIAQETLIRFYEEYRRGRYDRTRGRLRVFLRVIAQRRAIDFLRKHAPLGGCAGDTALAEQASDDELEHRWDEEEDLVILQQAVDLLQRTSGFQPVTIAAFQAVAVQARPAEEVAEELGLTVNSVRVAKSRCLDRVRQLANDLRRAYAMDEGPLL
ncbi:MAG: sigma-70 family RNA polymerase sigma factor [Planctomycetota bacterium]